MDAPVSAQVIGDVESFSLVVGPSGEVTHCASGGLRNVKNYPHFNQACKCAPSLAPFEEIFQTPAGLCLHHTHRVTKLTHDLVQTVCIAAT